MQTLNKWFFLLAAGALLASCAATSEQEVTLEQKLAAKGFLIDEETRSIRNWSLNGWTYVDDYHFIIKSGTRDHYLISLKTRSVNLRSAVFLGFSETAGSLTNTDRVILRDASGRSKEILIDTMYSLRKVPADP
jgi:hypothetical protein